MTKLLFGPDWSASLDSWEAVDDRIRGGSSQSHLASVSPSSGVRFFGTLDTKTLGGAGFASHAYRKPLPLPPSSYRGLRLVYKPTTSDDRRPGRFTLILKTTVAGTRPDGRRESTTSYEFDFDASSASAAAEDWRTLDAPFDDFKPFYRGREQPDAPALDPGEIKELAIMCRSHFERQSGDFDLSILTLSALSTEASPTTTTTWNPLSRLWSLFRL